MRIVTLVAARIGADSLPHRRALQRGFGAAVAWLRMAALTLAATIAVVVARVGALLAWLVR